MGPELLLIPPANRVGGGCYPEETGRSTSRSAFVQVVVGLLNTYLPLTVIVFVIIDVKWITARWQPPNLRPASWLAGRARRGTVI